MTGHHVVPSRLFPSGSEPPLGKNDSSSAAELESDGWMDDAVLSSTSNLFREVQMDLHLNLHNISVVRRPPQICKYVA